MAWFKIDDRLHSHPKRWRAGLTAMGLWVVAGSWSADQLTDGFIPTDMLAALGGRPADAQKLVAAGLWEKTDGGWQFHDWAVHQPSRATVTAQRAAWRERQKAARQRKGGDDAQPAIA